MGVEALSIQRLESGRWIAVSGAVCNAPVWRTADLDLGSRTAGRGDDASGPVRRRGTTAVAPANCS